VHRALLLSLGEYEPDELPPSERELLLRNARDWYRSDPDPGVHGAAEWLLRRWNQGESLKSIDGELATGKTEGTRGWYVNGQGQTLVVIAGPVEFMMGSTAVEALRGGRDDYGTLHLRQINARLLSPTSR